MNIQELAEAAGRIINQSIVSEPKIALQLPGKWTESGYCYLASGLSPRGEIVQENDEGVIALFDAVDVLAFCVAKGAKVNVGFKKQSGKPDRN